MFSTLFQCFSQNYIKCGRFFLTSQFFVLCYVNKFKLKMDNFQIETAQNITIQQNVAHVTTRMGSYLIDTIIVTVYNVVAYILYFGMGYEFNMDDLGVLILLLLPAMFYSLACEILLNGQTPGKMVNQIRVVKLDGSTPTFGSYVIRWFLRVIDISLFSGSVAVVTILLNGKGQRLGDIAAGTTAISEKKRVRIEDTLISSIEENHKPTFPQVTVLTDKEIRTIRNLFRDAKRKRKHKVIMKLSDKVKEMTNISTELTPMEFLDTVIKDYYYYSMLQ